ncbi:MAG: LLM class flavin-dependent oxidoreductase [Dehalococcoidia bacterium]
MRPQRLNFGIFMAPFHREGENPTLCYQRDLELLQALDHLGYDEAWIGEHHSGGWEIIASPELFIATAAERTKNIRLGTGVISIPYHHPFHIADRMVLLDHLTRGRIMLGVGPGALPGDANMLGIETTTQRPRMEEGLGIIIKLMTSDEPITYKSDWFELRDAILQIKPYQRPTMPMAVASTISPSGMTAAGKHGIGVLSVASYSEAGLQALATQWNFCEEAAVKYGKPAPDRSNWRVVMPFHLAESKEEAIADVEQGLLNWSTYFIDTLGPPGFTPIKNGREGVDQLTRFGGVVGTPDEAIETIEKLQDISGGFGTILAFGHEWANREKTLKSYELMARHVMPRFQDTTSWVHRSGDYLRQNKVPLMSGAATAILQAIADHTAAKTQTSDGSGVTAPGNGQQAVAPAKKKEKAK